MCSPAPGVLPDGGAVAVRHRASAAAETRPFLGGLAPAGLFVVQFGLTLKFLNEEAQTIASFTWLSWAYLALQAAVVAAKPNMAGQLMAMGFFTRHPEICPPRAAAGGGEPA